MRTDHDLTRNRPLAWFAAALLSSGAAACADLGELWPHLGHGHGDEDGDSDETVHADGGEPATDAGAPGDGGIACGSRGLAPCSEGTYCDFPASANCGRADAPGVCRPIPDACIEIYDPVCGCDGQTYGNDCLAAAAGVSAESEGECDGADGGVAPDASAGATCGGLAGLPCAEGEFCQYPPSAQCGAADQTGTCAVPPDVCIQVYDPVCGCDGQTYGNACEAAAASVSVLSQGECDAADGGVTGATCGGLTGLACAEGEFCNYPPSAQCGAADQTGTCELPPDVCTRIYAPVCGCDGQTYGNACEAAAARVSVVSEGECS